MLFSLVLPLSVFIYNYEQTDGAAYFRERLNEVKGDSTIDRFARKVGVARATMGGYLAGTRLPKADHLKKIAEKCGVSADYLIGLSDAKGTDNRDISIALGLSDEAIEVLRQSKENLFRHFAYDKIIADKEILAVITQYLFAFLEFERLKSQYRVVPVNGVSGGYADHKMIRLITWLPMWKRNMIRVLKQQQPLLDRLLLEYVVSVADEPTCSNMVGEYNNEDDYSDESFDRSEAGSPEWIEEFGKEEYEQFLKEQSEWWAQFDESELKKEHAEEQKIYDIIREILELRKKEK
ncbi:helix-turn-helix domain-containing protein [Agathobaculum hominis]